MKRESSTYIEADTLRQLYIDQELSMKQISGMIGCSPNKVVYWMQKHGIERRSIGDAIYARNNPDGDPFSIMPIKTLEDAQLFGMGVGLYWGEGNKANKWSIRLGNTDPALLRSFVRFLTQILGVNKDDLRFMLQIFTDIEEQEALEYWSRELDVALSQFGRPTVTISGSIGTYRHKSQYGVLTVMYHNRKLRDILVGMLPR